MKLRVNARQVMLCWSVGAVLVLLLFGLGASGLAPTLVQILLSPGLLLAGIAGYGAHDLEAIVLAIFGDSVLYGLLSLFALWVLRPALGTQGHQ